nr:DinB family protein [Paenibacillus xylanexedens]
MNIDQTILFIDKELTQTWGDYQGWFDLNAEVLAFKPQVGWSIEQILEHVTLTNHFLLIIIRKGKRKAIELSKKKDLNSLLESYQFNLKGLEAIAEHKSFDWIRPEHMEPKGGQELGQIKSLLDNQIQECK